MVSISPNNASTRVLPESAEDRAHNSCMWDTIYFCNVRKTRRREANVDCFHEAWAILARRARVFTSSDDKLGTVPRLASVDGEKQLRRVGLLESNNGGGLPLSLDDDDDLDSASRLGRITSLSMEGTRSNKPSMVSFKSRHRCHSLFRK